MAAGTTGAAVSMIASMPTETGGVKNSPRARAAVGAAVWTFYPHGVSNA